MKTEVNPKDTSRAEAFELWMSSPMPMVTLTKTFDVSRLYRYAKGFNNPMVMWGKYRKGVFKVTLPISFQFHHVQMDGGQAALFLDKLQQGILKLR